MADICDASYELAFESESDAEEFYKIIQTARKSGEWIGEILGADKNAALSQ